MTPTEDDVQDMIARLLALRGDATLIAAAAQLKMLVDERDMYQARCLAAAKQCDALAMQLEALRARRQKANDK